MEIEETTPNEDNFTETADNATIVLPDSPPSCKLSDNDIDRLAEALLRRLKES